MSGNGGSVNLATEYPEVAVEWHPTRNGTQTAQDVPSCSSAVTWWQCSIDPTHEWQQTVWDRTKRERGCPRCRATMIPTQSTP